MYIDFISVDQIMTENIQFCYRMEFFNDVLLLFSYQLTWEYKRWSHLLTIWSEYFYSFDLILNLDPKISIFMYAFT